MNPQYFDAHSHLNFSEFDDDRSDVLERMTSEKVWTITVGTNEKTSRSAVELAHTQGGLFATLGVHPSDHEEPFAHDAFTELVKDKKVVGIGECGFDYFRTPKEGVYDMQKQLFVDHIEFALKHNKALMLHMRPSKGSMDAYSDGLDILESYNREVGDKLRGNSHFFVGDTTVADRFLNLGFTISFDGPITFARDYDEVVKHIPLDMVLAETDAPFAAPDPHRRTRNEPSYVKHVVESLAAIKNEDFDVVREATVENTQRVFGLTQ